MDLKVIEEDLTICKITSYKGVNFQDPYLFTGKTDEELSLVCSTASTPEDALEISHGWRAFRIEGVLDFTLIGILSEITSILASCEIGVFVISTYNTDYILVKKTNLLKAMQALIDSGHNFV